MTPFSILILALLFAFAVASTSAESYDFVVDKSDCPATPFNNSDYLLLVHSNQVSFCASKGGQCNSTFVERLFDDKVFFTLHGLWPQLEHPIKGHSWPQCCSSEPFQEDILGGLRDVMANQVWPEVTAFSLWEHEWEKHGTCAVSSEPSVPYIRNQYSYFNSAVNLFFNANINKMLVDANILPDDNKAVNVGFLNSVFKRTIGVEPIISYSENKKSRNKIVSEIWICIRKSDPSFIQCPESLRTSHQARPSDDIVIPTKNHLH